MLDFAQLSKKDDTDYQFIFEELCRFVNLDLGDLKKHYQAHPEDRLHNVPRPNGGNLLISQAGTERFSQIAKRGLEAMGSEGKKHNIQEIVKSLKKEFVGRLLTSPETSGSSFDLLCLVGITCNPFTAFPPPHFHPAGTAAQKESWNRKENPGSFSSHTHGLHHWP